MVVALVEEAMVWRSPGLLSEIEGALEGLGTCFIRASPVAHLNGEEANNFALN